MTTEKALAILRRKQAEWVCHNDVYDVLEECIKEVAAEPAADRQEIIECRACGTEWKALRGIVDGVPVVLRGITCSCGHYTERT